MKLLPLATLLLAAQSPALDAAEPRETFASTSDRPRTISSDLSAKLGAKLPKYAPPKTTAPAELPSPIASSSSAAAPDRPPDDVVRLPNYDVREKKVPEFRERELLTPKGRADLALKRHPGLKLGPGLFQKLNTRRGVEMLAEEQQIERNAEMRELNGFIRLIESDLPRQTPKAATSSRAAE